MRKSSTKTLLGFCGRMLEMILITFGFILLGTRPVGINSLIFLLAVLALFVAQFIYFQRRGPRQNHNQ
ncbi:hypothetical protein FEZ41_07155 [Lentilactobacillus parafarraginis]|jgi:ABC-type polysaccharide/polyol phosphate export permease|nr:hypothetical protein [Lentilactobacillus parafarraginis]TLQ19352.1 hypothetical protein FEZ41_07155 [Lentilactobacillus parafarraginis]